MNTENELSKKFENGLITHNLTPDLLKSQGWHYTGGFHKTRPSRHENYFKMIFGKTAPLPEFEHFCICNNRLQVINCFISNRTRRRRLVIGSCCINRFIKKKNRTCSNCGDTHQNRKDNLCNDCRHTYSLCQTCNIVIKKKFTNCYKCNIIQIERNKIKIDLKK